MTWVILITIIILIFGLVVFRGAPYVPSQKKYVTKALSELYPLGTSDVLVDVGSGDGIVLRTASKTGAVAIGYELNPILVVLSRFLSRNDPRVHVFLADFWLIKLPEDTTIVYAFSVSRDMKKMSKKMQSEANRLYRSLHFMTYGSELPDRTADASIGGYHLYTFHPLHPS